MINLDPAMCTPSYRILKFFRKPLKKLQVRKLVLVRNKMEAFDRLLHSSVLKLFPHTSTLCKSIDKR